VNHSQRLPGSSIERTYVTDKVIFDENPAFADFCCGYTPDFGAATQLFRMQLEKFGSLFKIKRLHGYTRHAAISNIHWLLNKL